MESEVVLDRPILKWKLFSPNANEIMYYIHLNVALRPWLAALPLPFHFDYFNYRATQRTTIFEFTSVKRLIDTLTADQKYRPHHPTQLITARSEKTQRPTILLTWRFIRNQIRTVCHRAYPHQRRPWAICQLRRPLVTASLKIISEVRNFKKAVTAFSSLRGIPVLRLDISIREKCRLLESLRTLSNNCQNEKFVFVFLWPLPKNLSLAVFELNYRKRRLFR
jgi:hypothetical protein